MDLGALIKEPRGRTFAFVPAVFAGDEGQVMALDQVEVGVDKPGTGLKRSGFEEAVDKPESAWGEDASQLSQIICLVFDAVKTTEIEREIERRSNALHLCGVVGEDPGADACFLKLSFGSADSLGGEVETFHLPACVCEGDDIRACAATDIESATGRMSCHEIIKFGR